MYATVWYQPLRCRPAVPEYCKNIKDPGHCTLLRPLFEKRGEVSLQYWVTNGREKEPKLRPVGESLLNQARYIIKSREIKIFARIILQVHVNVKALIAGKGLKVLCTCIINISLV